MERLAEQEIERRGQGYGPPGGGAVCSICVGDSALASLVDQIADLDCCSFCEKQGESIAADVEDVLSHMASQIQIAWTHPDDVLYRDKEESSGFAGPVLEISEVFEHEGVELGNERFYDFVQAAFAEWRFTPTGVYATTEGEALLFGWEDLVRTVKHRKRYFFLLEANDRSADGAGASIPRGLELLHGIGRMIQKYGLLRDIKAGHPWYRARTDLPRNRLAEARDFGAPPQDKARQSRMSPAGVPMLYVSDLQEGALAEARAAKKTRDMAATVAELRVMTPMTIVDFSKLPEIPSVFDDGPETPIIRHELGFLHGFRRDIQKKVELDGREHVEYVPTQVVCEYLRDQLPLDLGIDIHGLAWQSGRQENSLSLSLFVDSSGCVDAETRSLESSGPRIEVRAIS